MAMTARWADKQKKKQKNHRGGGARAPLPPPWRRHCMYVL